MNTTDSGPIVLDIPADWTLPALGKRVVPPTGVVRTEHVDDTVTGYDTADGDLAELGIGVERGPQFWTLRRDGTTSEFPVAGRTVPAELRALLLGLRGGAPLRISERARVRKVVHRVSDETGADLGTITEVVREPADAAPQRWVEVAGWEEFAAAAVRRLVKADARLRAVPTDLAEVQSDTVGDVLLSYLREQRRDVLRADLDLRLHEDAVHAFRVAVRRIRSALRVVAVADPERVGAFDAELRWLSWVLGAVRDLQVLREHLSATFEAVPGNDAARRAVIVALDTDEAAARATMTSVLAGRRYLALLRTLRDWCATPPFGDRAGEPAHRLARYVKAAARDLDKRLGKAGGSADKLHSARKAAKRARYVASFAGEAAGKHGPAVVKRAKTLQTGLGDHQDTVLAADYLERVGRAASGEAAFGCGVLWAYEQDRANAILRRVVD